MHDSDPHLRTRTVARVVGPYLVVVAVTLFARRASLPILLPAFMLDAPLVLATGAFTLTAGLVIVALHHHWTSAIAICVTLIGIAAAFKGALLMIAPGVGAEVTAAVVRTPVFLSIMASVALLVGLWLSFVGWLSKV
jgi:hypothetical protein